MNEKNCFLAAVIKGKRPFWRKWFAVVTWRSSFEKQKPDQPVEKLPYRKTLNHLQKSIIVVEGQVTEMNSKGHGLIRINGVDLPCRVVSKSLRTRLMERLSSTAGFMVFPVWEESLKLDSPNALAPPVLILSHFCAPGDSTLIEIIGLLKEVGKERFLITFWSHATKQFVDVVIWGFTEVAVGEFIRVLGHFDAAQAIIQASETQKVEVIDPDLEYRQKAAAQRRVRDLEKATIANREVRFPSGKMGIGIAKKHTSEEKFPPSSVTLPKIEPVRPVSPKVQLPQPLREKPGVRLIKTRPKSNG
ncbi:MAG: hypothetical protein K1Y36_29160 [Blastocatellia bacterium]|nr:hypothetical protein [Blastocatellia bacterium]